MEPLVGQLYSFSVTLFTGMAAGFCYDYYRALKASLGLKKYGTHLGDLLFWLVTTGVVFFLLLLFNSGEMRFYVLVGLGLGALVYFYLFSGIVGRLLPVKFFVIKTLSGYILRTIAFLWTVALFPFRFFLLLAEYFNALAVGTLRAGGKTVKSAFGIFPGRQKLQAWGAALAFWRSWRKKGGG